MPTFSPQLLRRIAVVALIVGVLGLGAGASVNQVVSHFLALPEDAEPRTYTDKDAPAPRPASARTVASSSGNNPGEEVMPAEGEAPAEAPNAVAESEPEEEDQRPSRALPADKYAEIIVRRNIFDSSAVYQPAVAAVSGEGECVADDNIRLLATTVADPPMYSSALISEGASRESKARPYAIGESLGSQGKIAYIAQKRVCLEGGSCICMGQAGLAVKERPAGGGEEGAGTSDGAVSKTGENSYVVDRSFLEEQLGNAEALATQIRPRPHRGTDGEVDGYRLSSIKRGSVFDKLGVKNGDIIHSVNGQPMTSVEGAMSAYSGLSREKAFTFEITRRNQKVTLDYSVR